MSSTSTSRVNQLDAVALDQELCGLLRAKLREVLQFIQPRLLVKLEPELENILKLLLYKWTVLDTGSTVGQRLLDLEYRDVTRNEKIGSRKAWLFIFLSLGVPWIRNKVQHLIISNRHDLRPISNGIEKVEVILRLASLINFLIFLQQGWYVSLIERILRIRSVHGAPRPLRQVQFDYMNRELLWHGFAEFLSFVLPLINVHQLKNILLRTICKCHRPSFPAKQLERSPDNLKYCAICGEWPIHPYEIGCRHVYCYYCIKSNLMADPNYHCLKCHQDPSSEAVPRAVSLSLHPSS